MLPLKVHRARQRLTMRELAELANVSTNTIVRIEGRKGRTVNPTTQKRIAAALGVHPDDISEFALPDERPDLQAAGMCVEYAPAA